MGRLIVVAALLSSLGTNTLLAEPPLLSDAGKPVAAARSAVARGEALFDASNYGAALAEFTSAYDLLVDHPRRYALLNNIAACHERLFQYDLAIAFYQRYLLEGGESVDDRIDVVARLRALDNLLATLSIASNVTAEVWIDDRKVGLAPATIRVAPGTHAVELRAALHEAVRREVKLATGSTVRLGFELERLSQYSGLSSGYFWTFAGLTVTAMGVGVGLGVAALHADAVDESRVRRNRFLITQKEADGVQQLARTADIAFVGAAVFGASAIVLFFLTEWGEQRPQSVAALVPYVTTDRSVWQLGVRGTM